MPPTVKNKNSSADLQTQYETQGYQDYRKERDATQPGYGHRMHLAAIRQIEQAFFIGYQQNLGYNQQPQQQSQQKSPRQEKRVHIKKQSSLFD